MKCAVINDQGRVLHTVDVSDDTYSGIATASNTYLLGIAPDNLSDYWNGEKFVSIGSAPTRYHYFDYEIKQWVDPRALEDLKAQRWVEIKAERDKLEFSGFEYKGNIYDSDQVSQGRIMGAAMAGVDQVWTLANNTTVNLTGNELKELYAALQMYVAALHERGRIARFNIDVAMTPQDIEAVTL